MAQYRVWADPGTDGLSGTHRQPNAPDDAAARWEEEQGSHDLRSWLKNPGRGVSLTS